MSPRCVLLGAIILGVSACAGVPVDAHDGMRIESLGEKMYKVNGQEISFAQLELLLANQHPPRIVVEQSSNMMRDMCVYLIGVKLDIPVWFRSRNGAIQPVHFSVDSPDITTTDTCR